MVVTDKIFIGSREISNEQPPLVIAEMGINHGGDLEVAKQMALAACKAGVEVLKHQTHIPTEEMTSHARRVIPGNDPRNIFEIIQSNSLEEDEEIELARYCDELGLTFISTPFSVTAVRRLEELGVPAYKIGSGECCNWPILNAIRNTGKPAILSTGMHSIDDAKRAYDFLSEKIPVIPLHTNNAYPTKYEDVRLGAMLELASKTKAPHFGLSDHTTDNFACLGAVALGAKVVERHFTDSKDRVGPDIVCSMDPHEFASLDAGCKAIFQCRGGKKGQSSSEVVTAEFAVGSVCAIRDLHPGETIKFEDLVILRPAGGAFDHSTFYRLIGKKITTGVTRHERLDPRHLA